MTSTIVYAGRGSSHSWTWLADLFEDNGLLSAHFLDEREFVSSLDERVGIVIISGGDGFAIAEALSASGFERLKAFIERGGTYVGICAGAYLPLPSSVHPFSEFNLSTTKIENIRCGRMEESISPRIAVPYGDCSVVHPVRGPMQIADDSRRFIAPLYGGPIFKEPEQDQVLMRYMAFTDKTEFQIERREADPLVLGKPAIIKSFVGRGSLILAGPHLEHPSFEVANERFLMLLGVEQTDKAAQKAVPLAERHRHSRLYAAITDLKVAISGLENRSFTVGRKSWDGGRLLVLASAVEKRAWSLSAQEASRVVQLLDRARALLVGMKVGNDSDADETTQLLVGAARITVENHFGHMS